MSDCNELQALGAIKSEVDESLVRITFSNHCTKSQLLLFNRLRKECERQQGLCKNVSSDNLKLKAEIQHAKLELESMRSALDTMRSAKTESMKEFLLAKERKLTTLQRVEDGEKKYESLWIQCKKRYESIPFVQKWFTASSQTQELQIQIAQLDQETTKLQNDISAKILMNQELDKKRIVAMAMFFVEEKPKIIKAIQEKKAISAKIAEELNEKLKRDSSKKNITSVKSPLKQSSIMLIDGDWPNLCKSTIDDKDFMMPRLHFGNDDLHSFRANLDQLKKASIPQVNIDDDKFLKPAEVAKRPVAESKSDDLPSSPFKTFVTRGFTTNEPVLEKGVENLTLKNTKLNNEDVKKGSFRNKTYRAKENYDAAGAHVEEKKNFKNKKLIHIIEDIAVDAHDAIGMVATANPSKLQPVDAIGVTDNKVIAGSSKQDDKVEKMEDFKIFGSQEVLLPPTPFSDPTKKQDAPQNMKDETMPDRKIFQKKRVSFELPIIEEVPEVQSGNTGPADETLDSQLDNSMGNETFLKMKEVMLKKQKLDLSPDFVYAKNTVRLEEKIVTSKFFNKPNPINNAPSQNENTQIIAETDVQKAENPDKTKQVEENVTDCIEEIIDSSVKEDAQQQDKSVSGLLFTHGPNGIPDSLDVSINTTGFDDGDFPHCIDTSLLLSPKADMVIPGTSDNVVYSGDVPNFLTGLRKTGFSFFGGSSAPEANPEASSSQTGGNFNFNFGGDDKKNRGGLFSMFR